ncbi:MAG: short-chain dehydrogenase [Rhizobiales bacterium 62-17]|nr:SDR family oxidoreductase [Hyphomicrobiales bacterium]OJY00666.1 MAG: short-chain dehydrogenase [Rhizobiales bacterium 62-17]
MSKWTEQAMPDQSGRTILVTGANSGLGFVTSRELARKGAHVLMAVRDPARGEDALARIRAAVPKASIELRRLDLADLDQVKSFARQLIDDKVPLDILINNAGVMMPPRTLTGQGFELQFGVNHLAHFALTGLLLETLAKRQESRVVTVSSDLHRRGHIHFDDLDGAKNYGRIAFYAQSKFANVLFALELDRRLRAASLPVRSLLAHPGYAATNLQTSGPTGLLNLFMRIGNRFMAQSMEMGALPQLYAATAPQAESGQFIGPDGRTEMKGYPTVVQPIASARDPDVAAKFWALSEQLTGIKPSFATETSI